MGLMTPGGVVGIRNKKDKQKGTAANNSGHNGVRKKIMATLGKCHQRMKNWRPPRLGKAKGPERGLPHMHVVLAGSYTTRTEEQECAGSEVGLRRQNIVIVHH